MVKAIGNAGQSLQFPGKSDQIAMDYEIFVWISGSYCGLSSAVFGITCCLGASCGFFVKVNVDGAVFSAQKEAVVGVIIRDDKGLVVAALSRKICAPLGALEVEAKVFEAGHQLAKYVGIHNLILEVDSLTVYFALTFPYFSGFFYLRYGGRLLMIFVLLCFLRYVGKVI